MAFRYERQIRGALENAPDLTENTLDDVSEWRFLPDDAPVTFGRTKNIFKAELNQIVVPNTSSLWRVYKELGTIGDVVLSDDYINNEVGHEAEHGAAATKLGAATVKYSLSLWRYEGKLALQADTRIHRVSTVKLGVAAMLAHPKELSEGDEGYLMGLGYAGDVQEIGDRIKLFNRGVSSRETLPLPLSYKRR